MFDFLKKHYSLAESGVLSGSVDAHSHILPGVDDGVAQIGTSLKILEFEESLGVREVWCTPHVMEDIPNTTEGLKASFARLQEAYAGPIRLCLAAEYMMDNLFLERLRTKDFLFHGDGTVLVEMSVRNPPYGMDSMFSSLLMAGYTPMLAHPERYRYFGKEDYRGLVSRGVKLQMNLPSLTGYYGNTAREKAGWLLDNGFYSAAGSDCHRLHGIIGQYGMKNLTGSVIGSLGNLIEMIQHYGI